ncbi:MAG: uracil-DNA glycosylase [Pseudomonadota bacterium]
MSEPSKTVVTEPELRTALIEALRWQVEAGVDETISEQPVDRRETPKAEAARRRAGANRGEGATGGGDNGGRREAQATTAVSQTAGAWDGAEAVAEATRLAAAAPDLPALAEAVRAFDGSALKAGAKNCVFSDGDPGADLMVIGEGPGREEDRTGKPFVGPSGQLLDRMLAAIGRDRQSAEPSAGAYITNLTPWRPLGDRTPDDQEVAILLPFLHRHIALARPKAILCLGGAAAKHMMGARTGVTRFRGTWTDHPLLDGGAAVPCLASLHPAYLLRSPEMKQFAWRDLLALQARLAEMEASA